MIAMLLQTQTIILTALAVVREREVGTIEQILVTPIRPVELMLGKTLPNLLIALINLATIVTAGTLGFGVPFKGDFVLFLGLTILYVFSGLGLGLLISSVSQNQRQAQQLAMMTMFLGLLISGFVFPHYSMPLILQWISYIFPLTAFIPIARGIFMKGIGLPFLTNQVIILVVYDILGLFSRRACSSRHWISKWTRRAECGFPHSSKKKPRSFYATAAPCYISSGCLWWSYSCLPTRSP